MFDILKIKDAASDLMCPKCNVNMNKKMFGDVVLDVCKNCGGSWFDKDEVEEYIRQREQYNLY